MERSLTQTGTRKWGQFLDVYITPDPKVAKEDFGQLARDLLYF